MEKDLSQPWKLSLLAGKLPKSRYSANNSAPLATGEGGAAVRLALPRSHNALVLQSADFGVRQAE